MINRFALTLAAILLPASASAATYSAKPLVPAAAKRIVVRDIVWNCGPVDCTGATEDSRPLVLCQVLARKTGPIERFTVDGRALPASDLEACNKRARGGPSPELARN